ncbi:MAG: hypothetical protein IJU94_05455 [Clostridia bacterium]|nr:hypothetical protein [Clostridia bacterium]
MFPAFFRECESLKKAENGKKKSAKMKFGEKKERKRTSVVDTNAAVLPAAFVYNGIITRQQPYQTCL